MNNNEKTMEKIVSLCKGRGFIFAGSEIYGGLSNTWDYGPLGVELKNNVKRAWWKRFVQQSPYNVGLDSAILMNPEVWVATGHVGGFSDPLMDCKDCKTRHRADKLIEDFDIRSGEGADTITRSMSGGNQQKAIVAREISRDHDILLAVQPTRGLDVGAIEYIHRELVKQRDAGTAILLISLELDEVMNLSDRILVMFEGTIVADLNPQEVTVQELGLYMAGSKRQEPEGKAGERA